MTRKTSDFIRKNGTCRIADALDAADIARRNAQSESAATVLRHLFSAISPKRQMRAATAAT